VTIDSTHLSRPRAHDRVHDRVELLTVARTRRVLIAAIIVT
jgi:hypothetical protein